MESETDPFEPFFSSDLAGEIRREYQSVAGHGLPPKDAAAHVLRSFSGLLTDPQEGPVIFLALAALQARDGAVVPFIRETAIELIDTGEARRAYASGEPDLARGRKQLLAMLRDRLEETPTVSD